MNGLKEGDGNMTTAIMVLAIMAEHQHGLPAGLLTAVVMAETGGRSVVATGRGAGKLGCDVGVAQIHVPGCRPMDVAKVLPIVANLEEASNVLSRSRRWCSIRPKHRRCINSVWHRYNPGSRTWWPAVNAFLRKFRRLSTAHTRIKSHGNETDPKV